MKITVLLLFLYWNGNVLGAFPEVNVDGLSGEYISGHGSAHAFKANYVLPNLRISHEDIHFEVSKGQKKLKISDPSTTVEVNFDSNLLNIFKAFNFSEVKIKSDKKLFWIQSNNFNFFINDTDYELNEFYLETDVRNIPLQDDEDVTVVDGLVLNAILKIANLRFRGIDHQAFKEDLRREAGYTGEELEKIIGIDKGIPFRIKNLNFVVKDGCFSGRAMFDSWINLWFRVSGTVKTDKENTVLSFHLSRAKLGIFPIKKTLLRRIRALNLDGMQIKGDQIDISLKQFFTNQKRLDTKIN
jgi:hypothetical protein